MNKELKTNEVTIEESRNVEQELSTKIQAAEEQIRINMRKIKEAKEAYRLEKKLDRFEKREAKRKEKEEIRRKKAENKMLDYMAKSMELKKVEE